MGLGRHNRSPPTAPPPTYTLFLPASSASLAESHYALVRGLDFHKYWFNVGAATRDPGTPRSASTMANPEVRMLGPKAALVTYDRIVQRGDGSTAKFGETRVWAVQGAGAGRWQQLHFHRTPQPSTPAA